MRPSFSSDASRVAGSAKPPARHVVNSETGDSPPSCARPPSARPALAPRSSGCSFAASRVDTFASIASPRSSASDASGSHSFFSGSAPDRSVGFSNLGGKDVDAPTRSLFSPAAPVAVSPYMATVMPCRPLGSDRTLCPGARDERDLARELRGRAKKRRFAELTTLDDEFGNSETRIGSRGRFGVVRPCARRAACVRVPLHSIRDRHEVSSSRTACCAAPRGVCVTPARSAASLISASMALLHIVRGKSSRSFGGRRFRVTTRQEIPMTSHVSENCRRFLCASRMSKHPQQKKYPGWPRYFFSFRFLGAQSGPRSRTR